MPNLKTQPPEQQIFDEAIIVEIYNSKITTRKLAKKYSYQLGIKIVTRTISQIKSGTGPYKEIIEQYRKDMLMYYLKRRHGYDLIQDFYPTGNRPPKTKTFKNSPDPNSGLYANQNIKQAS